MPGYSVEKGRAGHSQRRIDQPERGTTVPVPSRRRVLPVGLLLGAALVVSGCSEAEETPEPSNTSAPSTSAPSPSASPSPTVDFANLTGVETRLTLDEELLEQLEAGGFEIAGTGGTELENGNVLVLPVTGGVLQVFEEESEGGTSTTEPSTEPTETESAETEPGGETDPSASPEGTEPSDSTSPTAESGTTEPGTTEPGSVESPSGSESTATSARVEGEILHQGSGISITGNGETVTFENLVVDPDLGVVTTGDPDQAEETTSPVQPSESASAGTESTTSPEATPSSGSADSDAVTVAELFRFDSESIQVDTTSGAEVTLENIELNLGSALTEAFDGALTEGGADSSTTPGTDGSASPEATESPSVTTPGGGSSPTETVVGTLEIELTGESSEGGSTPPTGVTPEPDSSETPGTSEGTEPSESEEPLTEPSESPSS